MKTIRLIAIAALILGFSRINAQMMKNCMMQDSTHYSRMMNQSMMGHGMMGNSMMINDSMTRMMMSDSNMMKGMDPGMQRAMQPTPLPEGYKNGE